MDDEVVNVLPIHYSDALVPNVHLHQFPLLSRPLQVPPSAVLSGKRIRARVKTVARKLEISVPVDTRPEVWNDEKGKDFGMALLEDDREKNQETDKGKQKEDPRLTEVRLRSEQIPQQGVYMLGIVYAGATTITIVLVLFMTSTRLSAPHSGQRNTSVPPYVDILGCHVT